MYTGDDFNYAELIAGDDEGFSHALLGIFDAIAPAASDALSRLAAGDEAGFHDVLEPTVPLSRHIFKAPTRFYKTGVVFLAYLNGHQDHFTMVGGQESARSTLHLAELFRLADKAGLLAQSRTGDAAHEDGAGDARHRALMRDFSADHRWLSLNTATVRKQGDLARHHRGLRAAWHPRHRSLARPGRGRRPRPRGARGARRRARTIGLLPRRHVHRRTRRIAPRRATTTAARSTRPRRWARPASCWSSAACRNIRGRAARPQRTSRRRARRSTTASPRCWNMREQANMPLAIEPLHPAYAADRACVNTTKQALDICDRLDPQRTRRARRRARRLSHLVGSGADAADRARRARIACSRFTSATGWCRPRTSSTTAA